MGEISCELGYLSRPDGSALFTCNKTVCLAAVYGPIEVKTQKLQIDKATVEVNYRPCSGIPGVADKLQEATICKIFEVAVLTSLHPRTCVSIQVQEMQNCGGLLACAVNAVCAALIHSGLAMKFLVAAVCCCISEDGELIISPNSTQIKNSKAVFTFVFDSVNKNIISTETSGQFTDEQFNKVLNICKNSTVNIFQFHRDLVKKYSDRITL